ncbi:MAG: SMC-Scp complex subunit ScpB [Candidatus Aenigmatarchaeota archaeon]
MNKKALIEAALFVSDKPLTVEQLNSITNIEKDEIKQILRLLQYELDKDDRGYELVETPQGYEFRLKPEYREKVAKLAPFADLGEGMMRTLAIVAAKQPVKQSAIVRYQGNKAYGYIKSLEEKGLIRTEKYGRTRLVYTTSDFEKYFGLTTEEIKKILSEAKQ